MFPLGSLQRPYLLMENLNVVVKIMIQKVIIAIAVVIIMIIIAMMIRKTLNLMTPFYGWSSTASRLEPL